MCDNRDTAIGAPGGHEEWVGGVAFLPDGKRIVTASMDRTLRIWTMPQGNK
jgi:WD40 repeat protein